ncbi:hypothetical protein AUR65_011585 [Haloferax marisrubri]|uniref:Uncharacterized protein n=1 Tax=Haloferax marisrubri TaxID=1544719 RepID=A0A2P4NPJ2_9EURY|nr:hypothetical protein AUR65_011585 [Haloferax marisrubri]
MEYECCLRLLADERLRRDVEVAHFQNRWDLQLYRFCTEPNTADRLSSVCGLDESVEKWCSWCREYVSFADLSLGRVEDECGPPIELVADQLWGEFDIPA